MMQPLANLVQEVAELLRQKGRRIVFAESCTAGLISASLARVPGISERLCGSAVVYRLDTKSQWLGISAQMLTDPGPVSSEVAHAMAQEVLVRTPEADVAAAVTGHLGPNAPARQDGLIFVGLATRNPAGFDVVTFRQELPAFVTDEFGFDALSLREWRQWKAAEIVLQLVKRHLQAEIHQS